MRRFIAYLFDLTWITTTLTIGWWLIRHVVNIDLPYDVFILVGIVLIFCIIEYSYAGQTPGRFLLRLTLVSDEGALPTIQQIFGRASVLFAGLPVLFLILSITRYMLFGSLPQFDFFIYTAPIVFLTALIVPLLFTYGHQSFHDLLFGTAVRTMGHSHIHRISRYGILITMLFVIGIGAIVGSVMHSLSQKFMEGGAEPYLYPLSGIESYDDMYELSLREHEINQGVKKYYQYYVGHGVFGYRHRNIVNVQWPDAFGREYQKYAYYKVEVTLKGAMDQTYQGDVMQNIAESLNSRGVTSPILVDFVWFQDILWGVTVEIRQPSVGILMEKGTVLPEDAVVIREPDAGGIISVHLGFKASGMPDVGASLRGPGF